MTTNPAPEPSLAGTLLAALEAAGGWSVPALIALRAARSPDRQALGRVGQAAASFARVHWIAANLADRLAAAGIAPGDRIAVMTSDPVAAALAWFGISLAGAIEVPINPDLSGLPLERVLREVRPRLILADGAGRARLAARISPDEAPAICSMTATGEGNALALDLAAAPLPGQGEAIVMPPFEGRIGGILFTSGTSGPPKGVVIPDAQAVLTAACVIDGLRITDEDILYTSHPMSHMAAKHCVVLAGWLAGACVRLDARFDPALWCSRITAAGATATISHGPMLEMIHATLPPGPVADFPLRRLLSSPVPRRLGSDLERRLGCRCVEVWGMTEIGVPCWSDLAGPLIPGQAGRPIERFYEIALCDDRTGATTPPTAQGAAEGEIVVRARLYGIISPGYVGEAVPALGPGGWRRTGDLARWQDGKLSVLGRISHRIRAKAVNISPWEIEEAALTCPGIREASCVGVPSGREHDEDIKLFVVAAPGAADEAQLLGRLAQLLPHFMMPRYISYRAALPRTPTGKIDRARLMSDDGPVWDRKAAGLRLRDIYTTLEDW